MAEEIIVTELFSYALGKSLDAIFSGKGGKLTDDLNNLSAQLADIQHKLKVLNAKVDQAIWAARSSNSINLEDEIISMFENVFSLTSELASSPDDASLQQGLKDWMANGLVSIQKILTKYSLELNGNGFDGGLIPLLLQQSMDKVQFDPTVPTSASSPALDVFYYYDYLVMPYYRHVRHIQSMGLTLMGLVKGTDDSLYKANLKLLRGEPTTSTPHGTYWYYEAYLFKNDWGVRCYNMINAITNAPGSTPDRVPFVTLNSLKSGFERYAVSDSEQFITKKLGEKSADNYHIALMPLPGGATPGDPNRGLYWMYIHGIVICAGLSQPDDNHANRVFARPITRGKESDINNVRFMLRADTANAAKPVLVIMNVYKQYRADNVDGGKLQYFGWEADEYQPFSTVDAYHFEPLKSSDGSIVYS